MILAVVVNYRTGPMTVEAVAAALSALSRHPSSKIVVVDNDSGDGSAEYIDREIAGRGWADRVELVRAARNGGFGYGCNLAIRAALEARPRFEFVYLLNPDAFPEAEAIDALIGFMRSRPHVGITGSLLIDADGAEWLPAFRFPSIASEVDGALRLGVVTKLLRRYTICGPRTEVPQRVDWVSGASMMVRAEVFDQIGFFDEDFFLMYEETDLCRRACRAGWECWAIPQSRVMHIGAVSTGLATRRRLPTYWFDSRRHYFHKNHGSTYLIAANIAWVAAFGAWRLRRRLQRKPDDDPPGLLADFLRHSFVRLRRAGGRAGCGP